MRLGIYASCIALAAGFAPAVRVPSSGHFAGGSSPHPVAGAAARIAEADSAAQRHLRCARSAQCGGTFAGQPRRVGRPLAGVQFTHPDTRVPAAGSALRPHAMTAPAVGLTPLIEEQRRYARLQG